MCTVLGAVWGRRGSGRTADPGEGCTLGNIRSPSPGREGIRGASVFLDHIEMCVLRVIPSVCPVAMQ